MTSDAEEDIASVYVYLNVCLCEQVLTLAEQTTEDSATLHFPLKWNMVVAAN